MAAKRTFTASEMADDLATGLLRSIGPKVRALTPRQSTGVAAEVIRRLEQAINDHALSPAHRHLITTLQLLAPPEAGDVLVRTLQQAMHLEGCCGCTRNRTMRALGAVRPLAAIPALVQLICDVDDPHHKQLAAVCIGKIVSAHGGPGLRALEGERSRLRRELRRLRAAASRQRRLTPPRPWISVPGTPKWFAAAERAERALERLLERGR